MAVSFCLERLCPIDDEFLFKNLICLLQLMSLLLGLIANLAEVLRVLFEDFDSFLEDLVVFGSSILA